VALLDEIGARLSTQSVASSSGVDGWLLVLSLLPDSTAIQDKVVALTETPGGPPYGRVELDRPSFQVRVRGESMENGSSAYTEGRAKIEQVKTELHGLTPGTYSSWYYAGIWAEQDPFFLEIDSDNRPHWICNFRALRSRTS
jgi:hypothetical protein